MATPATHALEPDGIHWRCSRCLLAVRPQHAAQAERQLCPVAELALAGARWLQGEAGPRVLFGRLRAFRHFCCPAEATEELPGAVSDAAMVAVELEMQAEHLRAEEACGGGPCGDHTSLCGPIFVICPSR